jgi:hypothetical protein
MWIEDRIDRIYSRVKHETIDKLWSKYPDINFTQDDSENVDAKFPTVYMFFDSTERGQTLDGGVVNAVYMTIRTKVSVSKAQGNDAAREVNAVVRDELKKLFFTASGSPIPTTSGDVKVINANYQRLIGHNDPLIN